MATTTVLPKQKPSLKHLSGLDATFLYLETPQTPMHVGSLHLYELPIGFKGSFHAQVVRHLAKRIHSDLTVRYEESRTQALGNAPQLQLVDEAMPPDRPLPRGTLRFGALGFAVGLISVGVLTLILESR